MYVYVRVCVCACGCGCACVRACVPLSLSLSLSLSLCARARAVAKRAGRERSRMLVEGEEAEDAPVEITSVLQSIVLLGVHVVHLQVPAKPDFVWAAGRFVTGAV